MAKSRALRSATVIVLAALTLSAAACKRPPEPMPEPDRPMGEPLRVHPLNPRYFSDGSGRAVYLTGSHAHTSFQDGGSSYPPPAFDYAGYLDLLERHNHNFFRLWAGHHFTMQTSEGPKHAAPLPWRRTGPGNAHDGAPKFDLTRFNPAYFERLRSRVAAARQRGFYVAVMLFEGWALHYGAPPWRALGHPFHKDNNINGIDGDPDGDGVPVEIHSLQDPKIVALQEQYVRQVIDTLNGFDNIIWEIANEAHPSSHPWQSHLIEFIQAYEKTKPVQHLVWYSMPHVQSSEGLWNSAAEIISIGWPQPEYEAYRNDPPANDGRRKIVISDTDHLWGLGGDRQWIWKSFARGLHPIYMDVPFPSYMWLEPADNAEDMRWNMGYTRAYAERMYLVGMAPRNELASSGYLLANPGKEYLAYQPTTGPFTLTLQGGSYDYEWFDPSVGRVEQSGTLAAKGGVQTFTPPFAGDAVLYLRTQGFSPR